MNYWRGRRVLIMGMGGFVGANLARRLVDLGADLVGLDLIRDSPSLRALGVAEVPVLVRDVRDRQRIAWAVLHGDGDPNWRPPEVVIHLAGMSHVQDCQERPGEAWESHILGTANVLEACRVCPAGQIRAVVVASSNHVYGSLPNARTIYGRLAIKQDSARHAWLEDDPPQQTDVYGTAKACADLLVRAYAAMGLPTVSLRHVNAFGPADPHRSHLITGTICDLLEVRPPHIRGSGEAIKGYLPIGDVVSAYLVLAEALVEGRARPGRPYNAGATATISVLAMVSLIGGLMGSVFKPQILGGAEQMGYVEHLSSGRLEALGWQRSDLVEGLQQTIEWYRSHGGMAWAAESKRGQAGVGLSGGGQDSAVKGPRTLPPHRPFDTIILSP